MQAISTMSERSTKSWTHKFSKICYLLSYADHPLVAHYKLAGQGASDPAASVLGISVGAAEPDPDTSSTARIDRCNGVFSIWWLLRTVSVQGAGLAGLQYERDRLLS